MRDLDANVTAFSDRPKRITFSMNPEAFFSRWKKAFGADRPNAALDLASLDRARSKTRSGDARVVVLELGRPRFRGETATFAARRLNELSPGLAHYGGLTDGESPRRFEEASLFIDAAGNDDAVQVFAINYNVLRGMGGMGGLGD